MQKILSQAGVASRRASEQLIVDGRVSVNGDVAGEVQGDGDIAIAIALSSGRNTLRIAALDNGSLRSLEFAAILD